METGTLKVDIKRITDEVFAPESGSASFLDRFVQGQENLPLTTGSVAGLPRVWLRKRGRLADTQPSLLFADLPGPSTGDTPSKRLTSDAIIELIERSDALDYKTVPIFGVRLVSHRYSGL